MFRYELDEPRKILVLTVYGTQDGWEAKLMRIDWPLKTEGLGGDWTLIVDLGEYVSPQTPGAMKEQKRLSEGIASTSFKASYLVRAAIDEVNEPFTSAARFEDQPNFLEAWRRAGGDPRNVTVAPPADGTKYPANNAPPQLG